MKSALKNDRAYTYTDYLTWSGDERWEIIDGTAYAMSPSPSPHHQLISGNLFGAFWNYSKNKQCQVYSAPFDVRLPKNGESEQTASTVVQPDIAIICDKSKLDSKGCNGSPDLIIEVLSPSTIKNDMIRKLNLYEQHGILEYWIVDPIHKTVARFVYDQRLRQYKRPDYFYVDNVIVSVLFPDLEIKLDKVFPD